MNLLKTIKEEVLAFAGRCPHCGSRRVRPYSHTFPRNKRNQEDGSLTQPFIIEMEVSTGSECADCHHVLDLHSEFRMPTDEEMATLIHGTIQRTA